MAQIKLNLDTDLTTSSNLLTINISSVSGNTLEIRNDGLYANASAGSSGTSGNVFTTGSEGITINNLKVSTNNIVHHCFTGNIIDNRYLQITDKDPADKVLCGDFCRVDNGGSYDYYVILAPWGVTNARYPYGTYAKIN